ncbi:hypothetical protein ABZ746_30565 [Streptomyces sp. NPDC020096]
MLTELRLEPGWSYLDLGSGAGVTGALVYAICGPDWVTLLDRDQHLPDAVRERLALLGYRPRVVAGDGYAGFPQGCAVRADDVRVHRGVHPRPLRGATRLRRAPVDDHHDSVAQLARASHRREDQTRADHGHPARGPWAGSGLQGGALHPRRPGRRLLGGSPPGSWRRLGD